MTEIVESNSHPLEMEEEKNRVMQEVYDIIKEYNEDPRLAVNSSKEIEITGSPTLQSSMNSTSPLQSLSQSTTSPIMQSSQNDTMSSSDTTSLQSTKETPTPPPKPHKESVTSPPNSRLSQAIVTISFKDLPSEDEPIDITTSQGLSASEKEQKKYQTRKSKRVTEISRTTNLNAKEGFLIKRGDKRKNWKIRWFVLKPDGYYYFETPKEWRPKNVIPTKEITLISKISDEDVEKLKPPPPYNYFFFFKVCTAKREFVCCATSIDELEDWVYLGQQALILHEKIKKLDEDEKKNNS